MKALTIMASLVLAFAAADRFALAQTITNPPPPPPPTNPPPPMLPDLCIPNMGIGPSAVVPTSGQFRLMVSVCNAGPTASAPFRVTAWAHHPSNAVCGEAGVSVDVATGLPARSGTRVEIPLQADPGMTVVVVRAFVDSDCAVTEIEERNNQSARYLRIGPPPPPPPPLADLAVLGIRLSPEPPVAGQPMFASVHVRNLGRASASNVALAVWADHRTPAQCGETPQRVQHVTLAAGETKVVTFELVAPVPAAVGHVLRAFIDARCVVREYTEANNQMARWYNTRLPPPPPPTNAVPDFAIIEMSIRPPPTNVGATVTNPMVCAVVKNLGAEGDAGDIGFWLAPRVGPAGSLPVPCGASNAFDKVSVGTLTNGQVKVVCVPLPAVAVPEFCVRAFVDCECITRERYEGNNQRIVCYPPPRPST